MSKREKLTTVIKGKSGKSNLGYEYLWLERKSETFSQVEIFLNDYIICSVYIQEEVGKSTLEYEKYMNDIRDTLQIFGFRI